MADWNELCRRACETAKKRGQDDALLHCTGEVVEAENARAAFLDTLDDCNNSTSKCDNTACAFRFNINNNDEKYCEVAKWFQYELADIAICVLSKWGERLKIRKFDFQSRVGGSIDDDNLKNCAMAVADAIRDDDKWLKKEDGLTNLAQSLGCVFYFARKEFENNFPKCDFGAVIEAKMAENEKKAEK